jgi:hypothetical protein
VRLDLDVNLETLEGDEADNTLQAQFVWSPYVLTEGTPVARYGPPLPGAGGDPNCDGLQFTTDGWGAVGMVPMLSGNNFDLALFDDYLGSTAGFSNELRVSASAGSNVDFVLVNGRRLGPPVTRWVGVSRQSGVGDMTIHQSNQVGPTLVPDAAYGSSVETPTVTVAASQLLKVHEVYLGRTDLTYSFSLDNLSGTADLNLGLYAAGTDDFAKSDYVAVSEAVGAGTGEHFDYQAPVAGYYGVVVWKRDQADLSKSNTYRLRVGPALSDLAASVTPPGFSSPVVPRNVAGASYGDAVVTATLDGNAPTTFLNWAVQQEGPNPMPAWSASVFLDDEDSLAAAGPGDGNLPGSYQTLNAGPFTVRGGRHTLTSHADRAGEVAESDETDNQWSGQWVWSALPVSRGVPVVRARPPLRGSGADPNSDGLQYAPASGAAWVTAMAPLQAGDDYDLVVYDDYVGSTTGFSHAVASSAGRDDGTEYVVGARSGAPATVYPAVVLWSAGGGGGSYAADQTDSQDRAAAAPAVYPDEVLEADRLANVYEAGLSAGNTYYLVLRRTGGAADLAFRIFPPDEGAVWSEHAPEAVASLPLDAERDTLAFAASATGYHPVVVCRTDGSGAGSAVSYSLAWGASPIVGVPGGCQEPVAWAFAGASPNPARGGTRLGFSLAQSGTASLVLYDLGGRRVRQLVSGVWPAGTHAAAWDGRADDGSRPGAGIYWARFEAGGHRITRRVVLLE